MQTGITEGRARKLASVQTVADIKPIPGADAIDVATVLGWHVVVKKGEFNVGGKCAYFEVDSLLPTTPQFEFLAKHGTKKTIVDNKEYFGYRLRTVRLRGQVSQGLCLSLSALGLDESLEIGADVSTTLGVVKYEAPIPASLAGMMKGDFPSFIPKTDEPRIQSFPDKLSQYRSTKFYVTEKVNGASATFFLEDGELNVCSRNINLKESEGNTYWRVARELGMKEKLLSLGGKIALQGELLGEGINGNTLRIKGHKVLFYTAYDMSNARFLRFDELIAVCDAVGIETVPIISAEFVLPSTVDELVAFATRKSMIAPEAMAEGVVIRSIDEVRDPDIGRLSFKALSPEYLLRHE